eukprot:848198-Alexandrium_andersonii.AAC.1
MAQRSLRADLAIPGSAVLLAAMPAEAALSMRGPGYRTVARTRRAMPVLSTGLTCARCRAPLGPLGHKPGGAVTSWSVPSSRSLATKGP